MFYVFFSEKGVKDAEIEENSVVVLSEDMRSFVSCQVAPLNAEITDIAGAAVKCYGSLITNYPGRVKHYDFTDVGVNTAIGIVSQEHGAPAFLARREQADV